MAFYTAYYIYRCNSLSKFSTIVFCILIGSGWLVDRLIHLDINVAKYDPLRASAHMPLPSWIVKRKAVLNIKNTDNEW